MHMNSPVETIRITKQGRDQLIKLRRITGIEQWNILCRWAMCVSLREPTPPLAAEGKTEGGVEMQWKTFAGEWSDAFSALIMNRVEQDGYSTEEDGPSKALRAHLHRGLGYLSSGSDTRSIGEFMKRWSAV